jgi:hypothetical protein
MPMWAVLTATLMGFSSAGSAHCKRGEAPPIRQRRQLHHQLNSLDRRREDVVPKQRVRANGAPSTRW